MTSQPTFSAVDHNTGSLLDLLAEQHPATPTEHDEWTYFVSVLQEVSAATGLIDQNVTRPLLRGQVKPNRCGAYFHRAARMGLIRAEGWNESNDLEQRNNGKPQRQWRWLGAQTSGHTSPAAGETPEAAARKGSQPAVSGTHLGT